jgi:hypothetical protein
MMVMRMSIIIVITMIIRSSTSAPDRRHRLSSWIAAARQFNLLSVAVMFFFS